MAKILALKCTDEPHLQCNIPGAVEVVYPRNAADVSVAAIPASHKKEIDYIVMYGSHGDFTGGSPSQLNGLSAAAAETLAGKLLSLNISAYSIILDCCFSAGFIPIYRSLLVQGRTKPGTILCHCGSAAGTMASNLGSSQFTVRQAATTKLEDLGNLGLDFVSLGVYVDGRSSPNYHIKSVGNLQAASTEYVAAIAGGPSEAADVNGLKTYLRDEGINVKESALQTVKTVMQNAIIV